MKIVDILKSKISQYPGPVLSPGSGRSWDNKASMTPSVWQLKDDEYLMFYVGQSYQTDHWLIGLARSKNLVDWVKDGPGPFIDFSLHEKEYRYVDCPSLIKSQGLYFLFYEAKKSSFVKKNSIKAFIKKRFICGLPIEIRRKMIRLKRGFFDKKRVSLALAHAQGRAIYFCVADNYMNFAHADQKEAFGVGQPGNWDSGGVFSPRVFRFKDKFYLLYGGSDGKKVRSGFAVSDDLCHWQRFSYNPVLQNGEKGSWDENHALLVDILEVDDGYCGFYEGEDADNRFRIGMAYSQDLIHWVKFEGNPILDFGEKGSFKERMVCGPRVIRHGEDIFLFHAAHNSCMSGFCGLAVLKKSE